MLHEIKANPKSRNHRTKRVGRGFGSGIGGRSTRGTKGQHARKSGNVRLGFEGGQTPLYMRVAKIGFNNHNFKKDVEAVTLRQLNYYAQAEDIQEFDLMTLIELGLVHPRTKYIKIIGNDKLVQKYNVHAHYFSKNAKKAIEDAKAVATILK